MPLPLRAWASTWALAPTASEAHVTAPAYDLPGPDFDFAWARGGSSSLSIVGYTLSVRSVPRYQLRPLSVLVAFGVPS